MVLSARSMSPTTGVAHQSRRRIRRIVPGTVHELVQGSLGCAVAVPPADLVIADAPNLGGDGREDSFPLARQEWEKMLHHQGWPGGVDSKELLHLFHGQVPPGLLWLYAIAVQESRRIEDQSDVREIALGMLCRCRDRRFISHL